MSIALRIVLFAASVLTCAYIARKLKKSQIQVMDTVFWIGLSVLFIILSVFPNIASILSTFMGFQAPVDLASNVLFENESSNNFACGIICSISNSLENNFSCGI